MATNRPSPSAHRRSPACSVPWVKVLRPSTATTRASNRARCAAAWGCGSSRSAWRSCPAARPTTGPTRGPRRRRRRCSRRARSRAAPRRRRRRWPWPASRRRRPTGRWAGPEGWPAPASGCGRRRRGGRGPPAAPRRSPRRATRPGTRRAGRPAARARRRPRPARRRARPAVQAVDDAAQRVAHAVHLRPPGRRVGGGRPAEEVGPRRRPRRGELGAGGSFGHGDRPSARRPAVRHRRRRRRPRSRTSTSTNTGAWSLGLGPLRALRSISAQVTLSARSGESSTRSMRMPRCLWKAPAR